MIKIVGVRFRTAGKIYYFDPLEFEVNRGDHVIVETARGIEYGTVVGGIRRVEDDKVVQPLKPVLRIANERDDEQAAANKEREREAFKVCQEKIQKHGLEMKLIDAEYTFDNNKVLFYFTADGRIDFRDLVKDLASVFRTRIELRQIGVRDETKILGGYGICGRPLCCHAHLSEFVPVSIKMAKEQNLSLNPTKISGVCGRLMCCLKHEEETYEELNRKLPNPGDQVTTADGLTGEVSAVNVLRQLVKVLIVQDDEKEIREYPVDELTFRRRHGKGRRNEAAEMISEELNALQDEGTTSACEDRQENEGRREGKGGREKRRERRENGENQNREPRENREASENREDRESREPKEGREGGRGSRENREDRPEREGRRGNRENREPREPRENREPREPKEGRDGGKASRENREDRPEKGERRERRRGRREDRREERPADAVMQEGVQNGAAANDSEENGAAANGWNNKRRENRRNRPRPERRENAEAAGGERPAQKEHSEKSERPEKGERRERPARAERPDRQDRPERPERAEHGEGGEARSHEGQEGRRRRRRGHHRDGNRNNDAEQG